MTASTPDTLSRIEELTLTNDFQGALELLETLYDQQLPSSDRGRGLALETVCLEKLDRADDADQLINEVMQEEGDDLDFVLAAGMQFSDLEAYPLAETFFANLCELDPENFMPWHNLAITLGREQRYPESITAYDKAIELNPDFADAYYHKGYCLGLMDQTDQAAEAFVKYLELKPEDGEVWMELAGLEIRRGNSEAGYAAFHRATETDDAELAYYQWNITAVQINDPEQVAQCLARLQEINPEGWRSFLARADHAESQENFEDAWDLLTEIFNSAMEDESLPPDERDYVVATLFRFAQRNYMDDDAKEYVDRIFDEQLFTLEVLNALQLFDNLISASASGYQVVFKTTIVTETSQEEDNEDRFIIYGVSADSPDHARDVALNFEARCSNLAWDTYEIQQVSPPDEGLLGVYWRSPMLDALPG